MYILKKTLFIKNALILTVSSFLLRFAGIIFKVWITRIIGSEGVGLYQLIFSFYMLAATFATSGISTAVTRLVSEELALGTKSGSGKILRRAIELTLIIAVLSVFLVFFGAKFIAQTIIGDIRALPALKILPLSLPFMGVSSCLRGYFIASRKVTPSAFAQIFEQIIRIALILILVKRFISKGIAAACCAVLAGDVCAEAMACLLLFICFRYGYKKLPSLGGRKRPPYPITKKLVAISLPITSGRYLNTALRTAENVLVPKNLAKYPLSGDTALSQFGMIKGMALPILFFPSTLLNSISTLLIPEMSEAAAKKQNGIVRAATEQILRLTALISFIFSAIFLYCGETVGNIIYHSSDVGFLIKALSPIVPFMYLDSISDGILKGLDQQNFSFRTAVSDSTLRIIFILLILPLTGMMGFIGIMYFSNFFTCYLNVKQLCKISKARLKFFGEILFPILIAFSTCYIIRSLLLFVPKFSEVTIFIVFTVFSVCLYAALLVFFKIINIQEILHIFKK